MSITKGNPAIQSGIVLEKKQISAHTFHLKIQSNYFAEMQYIPGFTMDIFLGNPIYNLQIEKRKYSFWNYEPVCQVADFAICTFSNGKGAEWIQLLQAGNTVQQADIFPDIDLSYPLNFHIINPTSADIILNKIIDTMPINLGNTIAYIFGHPDICITIHNFLKKESNFMVHNLRTKPFWKSDHKIRSNG